MVKLMKLMIILVIALLIANCYGQEKQKKYYFYHPEYDYGSELYFNPFTTFINGGFDILRNGGHTKVISARHYESSNRNVWRNISSPINTIEEYGWKHFISEEIIPLGFNKDESQFVPNYMHHVIGSGILYVKMSEWYDYHSIAYPRITAAITSLCYHYVNEVMENDPFVGNNPDPVADLLIFNPLGLLLFSSKTVKEFFSQNLKFYDWSLQPMYNPTNRHLENAGQQFFITHRMPYTENHSVFLYYGIYGIVGISYNYKKEYNFSGGLGLVVNKLQENRRRESRYLTPKLDGAAGFFYDRNRSLMTSILISGPKMYNVQVNIYPGFMRIGWFRPGMYFAFGEWDGFQIGISFAHVPFGLLAN